MGVSKSGDLHIKDFTVNALLQMFSVEYQNSPKTCKRRVRKHKGASEQSMHYRTKEKKIMQ